MMKPNSHFSPVVLCFVALSAVVNLIGGSLALLFRLPVYLDSIGTILTGILLGPVYGMIPGLLSGLLSGFTSDIYALYYIPVQLITGLLSGLVFYRRKKTAARHDRRLSPAFLLSGAALISLPGTVAASFITAVLFGGVTSSGSTILVQFLSHCGLSMTASVCIVQALTDYADRVISLALVLFVIASIPDSVLTSLGFDRKSTERKGR